MEQGKDNLIPMGRISGLFGVRGWVKVVSHTDPTDNILEYSPWYLRLDGQWRAVKVEAGQGHGKAVVAKIESFDDRDAAASLLNADIAIKREQLPPLAPGEYYWIDLIGLSVLNKAGSRLGEVTDVMPTGANDVLVVRNPSGGELLIPYVTEVYILNVDLEKKVIQVDWEEDF
ncbi:MAG: ribosome maturation factor RimM [Pseudomonadota bacterium]